MHLYLLAPAMAGAVVLSGAASAQETFPGTFSANIGLTSDYVYQGFSQTDGNPAIQGGFDWSHDSGVYLGTWASNVDFDDGDEASIEIDIYGGIAGEYRGFTWDVGGIYYAYPGANEDLDYDYFEVMLGIGYDFGVAAVDTGIAYSSDFFGGTGNAVYYQAGASVPLYRGFSLNGHAGFQALDEGEDYTDWSVGLGYAFDKFDVSVTYYDTNVSEEDCAGLCDARAVVAVGTSF